MFPNRRNAEALAALRSDLDGIRGRLEALETIPRPPPDVADVRERLGVSVAAINALEDRVGELTTAHHELRDGHKDLILAVSEGIERTERAERRVQATVKRARKELAERGLSDAGLEAEDHQLSDIDGARGGNGEVPAVREPVARAAPEASSIRGVPLATLHRVRGF